MLKVSIKAARINAELSTTDAAKQLGISSSTLYNYESGQTAPPLRVLMKMLDAYSCELDDLIFLSRD